MPPAECPRDTAQLLDWFGIDYRAPVDARDTGLPAGSFDLITSTFTLEHIPAPDIAEILRESARLLAPGGVLSSSVDLQDHYSFADPRISVYNFLRFSERSWRLINSPLHYQNRLRAKDQIALHEQAGLRLVDIVPREPDETLLRLLEATPIAAHFRERYTQQELAPTDISLTALSVA
jgi:2-polyprenyl-3-methyl-5-hydroxy-6-metoxy-1,4-benzoquinol methylase